MAVELCLEAGVPDGAIGVVTTSRPGPVVATVLRDPRVRALSFTDSTAVGRFAADTRCGPLITDAAVGRVGGLVDGAVGLGAKVLTGGTAPGDPGSYYPPTVLVDVAPASALVSEEIFGPVAGLQAFSIEDEAVAGSPVRPAAPFDGVKQSGLGREGGREGLREFTETKYIAVEW